MIVVVLMLAISFPNLLTASCRRPIEREGRGEGGHRQIAIIGAALLALSAPPVGCSNQSAGARVVASELSRGADSELSTDGIPHIRIPPPAREFAGSSAVQSIDLGTVRQGQRVRRAIIVENRTLAPVIIDRFEASCECLTLSGLPLTIPAGNEGGLEVAADESRESEFHGALGVEVTAWSGAHRAFEFVVLVRVDKVPEDTRSARSNGVK
jgi:hypothetical protein